MENPSLHLSSYLSLHMRTTATIDTTRPTRDTKIRTANRMNTGSMTSLLTLRVLLITSYLVLYHLKKIKSVPTSLWFRAIYVTENKLVGVSLHKKIMVYPFVACSDISMLDIP